MDTRSLMKKRRRWNSMVASGNGLEPEWFGHHGCSARRGPILRREAGAPGSRARSAPRDHLGGLEAANGASEDAQRLRGCMLRAVTSPRPNRLELARDAFLHARLTSD